MIVAIQTKSLRLETRIAIIPSTVSLLKDWAGSVD